MSKAIVTIAAAYSGDAVVLVEMLAAMARAS
jgi:hypothetical protein